MRWLGIAGLVLIIAGLIVPMFGPMFDRNFGYESLALTLAGMGVLAAGRIRRSLLKDRGAIDGSYGDATGGDSDRENHHAHNGEHDGDGSH